MKLIIEIENQTYAFMDQIDKPEIEEVFYNFHKLLSNVDYLNEKLIEFDKLTMGDEDNGLF